MSIEGGINNVQNRNDHFERTLKSLARDVGAEDAMFLMDFSCPDNWLGKTWVRSLKGRGSILYSSSKVGSVLSDCRRLLKSPDVDLLKTVSKPLHNWTTTANNRFIKLRTGLLLESGYKNVVSISLPLLSNDDISGRFVFFFDKYCEQSELDINQSINNMLDEIMVYQQAASALKVLPSPLEDYGLIKKSTVSIIKLLSEGYSRKEISELHYMSSRGIDYHIDKAKFLLGANNAYNLVHKAHRLLLF
ncbi:helix-turn-helix transcriptional regulator [Shewanella youngdeokensis]|uniref:HTH luxR-type domain-containing protein n=1 Tax=Shewanella youngdeokensis TaxID=2999068 RepID=A0ABZ0JXF9_9GAMM|nr:hypothetical protein RGE70_16315 [Shewanella sp. DAU334]